MTASVNSYTRDSPAAVGHRAVQRPGQNVDTQLAPCSATVQSGSQRPRRVDGSECPNHCSWISYGVHPSRGGHSKALRCPGIEIGHDSTFQGRQHEDPRACRGAERTRRFLRSRACELRSGDRGQGGGERRGMQVILRVRIEGSVECHRQCDLRQGEAVADEAPRQSRKARREGCPQECPERL